METGLTTSQSLSNIIIIYEVPHDFFIHVLALSSLYFLVIQRQKYTVKLAFCPLSACLFIL